MEDTETTTQDTTVVADQGKEALKVEAKAPAGTDAPAPSIQATGADAGLTADPVADMRARAAAEQERITAVR